MLHQVMLPKSWCRMPIQDKLFKAGLFAPVYAKNLESINPNKPPSADNVMQVPFIGDTSMELIWKATGGNPLADEDPEKMCLLISPPIPGFNYDAVFHGEYDENSGSVFKKDLPDYFVNNVSDTISYSISALKERTMQNFTILATKLNPLSSGKATVVMFLKFDKFVEFQNQEYFTPENVQNKFNSIKIPKIRIVPKPFISKYGEKTVGIKISFVFYATTENLFDDMYSIIRHFVEKTLGFRMKFVKSVGDKQLDVFAYLTNPYDDDAVKVKLKKFAESMANAFMKDVSCELVEV